MIQPKVSPKRVVGHRRKSKCPVKWASATIPIAVRMIGNVEDNIHVLQGKMKDAEAAWIWCERRIEPLVRKRAQLLLWLQQCYIVEAEYKHKQDKNDAEIQSLELRSSAGRAAWDSLKDELTSWKKERGEWFQRMRAISEANR